jgi:nitrite reductase (NADH) small subunit
MTLLDPGRLDDARRDENGLDGNGFVERRLDGTRPDGTRLDETLFADTGAVPVCRYDDLLPERGAPALVGDHRIALFRLRDGTVRALSHRDSSTGADIIARGSVGSRGEVPTVASPVDKQVFSLLTGECLDDPEMRLAVFAVAVRDGVVAVVPEPRR